MNRSVRLTQIGRAVDDPSWQAILGKRAAPADRPWFLVVTTTGILCQPGCPARTPFREHIRIVDSVAEGLAAGARPCLRCHPERSAPEEQSRKALGVPGAAHAAADDGARGGGTRPTPDSTGSDASIAGRVLQRLERALIEGEVPPTDQELAMTHHVSERRLRAIMRETTGVSPRAWLAARRAERLREGLAARQPVLDALLDAGYESSSSAYEAANATLGMAPGRYRERGAGERIRWTITDTALGWALIGATDRGLCAVKLGDDPGEVEAELRAEFANAEIARDDEGLVWAAGIVADLAAGRPRPEAATIPLDLAGTAFRRRVWEELRRIPAGETWSYQFLAAAVGAPKAARAAGSACATNPVPLVVPCHRVVGSDGSLHGYRYGLDRKRRILQAEAAANGRGAANAGPGTDGEAEAGGATAQARATASRTPARLRTAPGRSQEHPAGPTAADPEPSKVAASA